jgi:hypothetical protein
MSQSLVDCHEKCIKLHFVLLISLLHSFLSKLFSI